LNRNALRLALVAALLAAACSGQNPPPPAATPTPGSAGGLRPLSSREAGAPAPAAAANAPALPPGHPPIERPMGVPAKSAGAISGTIALSAALRGQVAASDVLYVMAKSGKATLAVRRHDKVTFPFAFEISGADAMGPGSGLAGPVDVVARLSKSGDAIPSKGDLEGTAKNVAVPAKGVTVTIDHVRE
jgi:cytochrome c-type biogenesis protein CcmH